MSNRIAFAMAAGLWGAALGLLVYRYGVLGLMWNSHDFWFPGIAAGLAVAGRSISRDHERPSLPPLIGAGLAGCAAAMAIAYLVVPPLGHSRLATHQFPGFTIDLPSGDIRKDDHTYTAGGLQLAKEQGVVIVQWEPGGKLSPEELKALVSALAPALGGISGQASVATIAGADTIRAPTDKGVFEISMVPCGVRHVMIATGGADGMEALHARVVASFQCHPDPAQETQSKSLAIPYTFDLPGWRTQKRDGGAVDITDGHSVVTLQPIGAGSIPDSGIEKLIQPMFQAAGVQVTTAPSDHGRVPLTLTADGQQMHGWAQLFPCGSTSLLVLALFEDAAAGDPVHDAIVAGHCLRAGEAPPHWPDAAKP